MEQGEVKPTEAISRYHVGKAYGETVKLAILSPHYEGRETMAFLPLSMLMGFSVELLLKAWLLQSGMNSKDVRSFGHDLAKLYAAATKSGLESNPAIDELVDVLAGPHQDFTYRYVTGEETYVALGWFGALNTWDALQTAVDEFVGASASLGLVPGH